MRFGSGCSWVASSARVLAWGVNPVGRGLRGDVFGSVAGRPGPAIGRVGPCGERRPWRTMRPGNASSRRRSVRAVRVVVCGRPMAWVQRSRLWASAATTVQAALALNLPDGRYASAWSLRSRMHSSTTASWRSSASTTASASVRLVRNGPPTQERPQRRRRRQTEAEHHACLTRAQHAAALDAVRAQRHHRRQLIALRPAFAAPGRSSRSTASSTSRSIPGPAVPGIDSLLPSTPVGRRAPSHWQAIGRGSARATSRTAAARSQRRPSRRNSGSDEAAPARPDPAWSRG